MPSHSRAGTIPKKPYIDSFDKNVICKAKMLESKSEKMNACWRKRTPDHNLRF